MNTRILLLILALSLTAYILVSKASFSKTSRFHPLTIEERSIFMPAVIDNVEYKFLLDTGSRGSSLDNDIVKKLKLKKVGGVIEKGAQRTGKSLALFKLPKIKLGETVFTNIDVAENDTRQKKYDGVIGMDILKQTSIFYLDLNEKHFSFEHSPDFKRKTGFLFKNDKIFFTVSINGKYYDNFMMDTGSGTCCITKKIEKELNLTPVKNVEVVSVDTNDSKEVSYFTEVREFCIGKMCKKNHLTIPQKWLEKADNYNGIIGFRFFENKRFILDFKNKLFKY